MKEFIEKLIGRLEETVSLPKMEKMELRVGKKQTQGFGFGVRSSVRIVNELAEEYKNTNIITEFLQYARDNADNYDTNEGWSLADLIDLSIKYSEEYINTSTDTSSGWVACSERLPEMPKENPLFEYKPLEVYLVSLSSTDYPWRAFWNGKYFTDGFSKVEPIAWMPLPAPYKEGE